ncbi:AraC family transcriptional regulator [Bacillus thuringiensis]|uniref:AraC family transcriptional regulator n=1 Tax=Bacillus thuringiensis TaxID=1428 RepID=UPI000BF888E7|nr:GyrI-like domain-containing protein [Bacillus thuringiensis]PFL02709.1 AraC family transcriptional regulator [Bacillus thuringiensis]PGU37654.1 AraC family transcriptional regulator [Bacillus thuringiensis]
MKVVIKKLPPFEVAYIRRTGSYFEPQDHWGKLLNWSIENKLYPPEQSFIGISLDNPELVASHKCRHDACVTIPENFDKEKYHDVQFKRLDGGNYGLYQFYDEPHKLSEAYQYMYAEWLPNSEYDRDNLEFCLNNVAEDLEGKLKVDLFVPIKNIQKNK